MTNLLKNPLKIGSACLLFALSACAAPQPVAPPSGQPLALSPASSGEVDAYLRKVKVTRPGAFAVSPDGLNTFYTWCDDIGCATTDYAGRAKRGCQALTGSPCLLLYFRNEPRLTFTRAASAAEGGLHKSEEQRPADYERSF